MQKVMFKRRVTKKKIIITKWERSAKLKHNLIRLFLSGRGIEIYNRNSIGALIFEAIILKLVNIF